MGENNHDISVLGIHFKASRSKQDSIRTEPLTKYMGGGKYQFLAI